MAARGEVGGTDPPSILIDLNQSPVKEPHLASSRTVKDLEGDNDFCRQHRALKDNLW